MDLITLDAKITRAEMLIRCWVDSWGVNGVNVSFSGGKDSTVLLHIARRLFPNIPAVFYNTGLEYPEIVAFVKTFENIEIYRPKKSFAEVIRQCGWPVVSKAVSRHVNDCQNANPSNQKTVNLRLTGYTSSGKYAPTQMLAQKWRHLIIAPFKCSDKCCAYLKKEPAARYEKITGRKPMVGVMKADSQARSKNITLHGCNMYDLRHPVSYPLADWTSDDVWAYIRQKNIPYCSIYDKGEKRTGCTFCLFGMEYDRDRFLRLKQNSPAQYDFVVNKLRGKQVLDYLGYPY